jgi:hypothetical protein
MKKLIAFLLLGALMSCATAKEKRILNTTVRDFNYDLKTSN